MNLLRKIVLLLIVGLATLGGQAIGGANDQIILRKIFNKKAYSIPKTIPYRKENPYSKAKEELGNVLFFDTRLSGARMQACVSCHQPDMGWEIGVSKPQGAEVMPRKSPTILNIAWAETFFWDGRADTLPKQYLTALASSKALNIPHEEFEKRLQSISGYQLLFKKAFPGDGQVNKENAALAIEIFQRGIVSVPGRFDAWVAGDKQALSKHELAGAELFAGKAGCIACHNGWAFTDYRFHDIGIADDDPGRGKSMPDVVAMQHAFKTPTLRDIGRRGPFMHNGALMTLMDVIDHFDKGGEVERPSLAPEVKPLQLSNAEKHELIAFLLTLTGANPKTVVFPRRPI